MIIVAGGDSFIYGSELADCNDSHSLSTFTALLAQGCDYQCVAWPGSANNSIARAVMTQCEANQGPQGVIVSWTFPSRYEFKFTYDTGQRTGEWYSISPWTVREDVTSIREEFKEFNQSIFNDQVASLNRAKKTGIYDFAKMFYSHVGSSEYWEIYSSLKELVFLQNYLKLKQIPYLFTCADNTLFDNYTVQHMDRTIKGLINQVDMSKWCLFDNKGFYQWSVDNKYRIGTTHPLEQAHADAALLMKDKFNELVKKHLQ